MPLHTPSAWTFWLSVVLAVLAIVSRLAQLPYLAPYAGWVGLRGLPHSGDRLHRQDEVNWIGVCVGQPPPMFVTVQHGRRPGPSVEKHADA